MNKVWMYLSSSELVYKVQNYFGVENFDKDDKNKFVIKNKFFYYLFLLGTELGDEIFYGIFIPIMFFNVDTHLARRFIFQWFLNMYIGQALKEVFKYDRPKLPAIQMQKKWSNEYSLPSTHAMGSLSIAVSILYFASDRYTINVLIGSVLVFIWVGIISLSRVYLGMHSVLDLLLGFLISFVLLTISLPLTNSIETFFAVNLAAPCFFVLIPILLIIYFPITENWTPTRGDTCVIAAVFSGTELGTWFNYQWGLINVSEVSYPISLEFGSLYVLAARTVLGLAIVGLTEVIGKYLTYSALSMVVKKDKKVLKNSENSNQNVTKIFVDLTSNYLTYFILGFNCLVTVPAIFKMLNMQRESFFNEL